MNRLAVLLGIILTFAAGNVFARTVYVQNPKAKLLNQPSMNAPGTPLQKGTALTALGDQGMFVQVRAAQGNGYVPRLFVSPYPPGKRMNLGGSIKRSDAVEARARASTYSRTAAARGLVVTQKSRLRGRMNEYDFAAVDWLEDVHVSEADVEAFRSGTP